MAVGNVVITGANSGIGYEAALHFARAGADVVMACRNPQKAEQAQADIHAQVPGARTRIILLDVSDPGSLRGFAHRFGAQVGVLDLLINNAGIVAMPLARNEAGHELQLATNYLGAFALTGLLLPYFRPESPGRIVNVGSLAHLFGKVNPDDLDWETTPYGEWKAYANSKLAIVSYTIELNRRLAASGSPVIAAGAHPGFANTHIADTNPIFLKAGRFWSWVMLKMKPLVPTAAHAARSIILAAEGENVAGGDYYGPGGFLEIGGKPAPARVKSVARDPALARRLWTVSEGMTGVSYLSDL